MTGQDPDGCGHTPEWHLLRGCPEMGMPPLVEDKTAAMLGITPTADEVQRLASELERLRRFAALVEGFIVERGAYITAIKNCSPDNSADYWRWQGHAESRRQLLAALPWPPDTDDAERISRASGVTR